MANVVRFNWRNKFIVSFRILHTSTNQPHHPSKSTNPQYKLPPHQPTNPPCTFYPAKLDIGEPETNDIAIPSPVLRRRQCGYPRYTAWYNELFIVFSFTGTTHFHWVYRQIVYCVSINFSFSFPLIYYLSHMKQIVPSVFSPFINIYLLHSNVSSLSQKRNMTIRKTRESFRVPCLYRDSSRTVVYRDSSLTTKILQNVYSVTITCSVTVWLLSGKECAL